MVRCVVFWPSTRPNMPFQGDAPEVTHSDGTYEEKSRRLTWLTKWDKEKIPWDTHRLMHRKRVTSELHDSYFHLMTIKHAIPKIEWAIEWALNYYIILSRQLENSWSKRRDVVGKATPGRRGPRGPRLSWSPEKLLIRYSKESHHPAERWAPGPTVEQPWWTRKTQRWRP